MKKVRNRIYIIRSIALLLFLFLISRNYKEIKPIAKIYLHYDEIISAYSGYMTERDAKTIIKEMESISEPIRNHCDDMIYVFPESMNPNLVDPHQAIAFALLPCQFNVIKENKNKNQEYADFLLIYNKKLNEVLVSKNFKIENKSNFYTLFRRIK